MKPVDVLYSWLASARSSQADDALSEALVRAEPEYAGRIVETLLRRRNAAAWGGLIACWEELSEETRALLRREPALMQEGIVLALKRGGNGRISALAAYDDTLFPRIAYLLPELLRSSEAPIAERAASVLRRVVQRILDHPPPAGAGEDARRKHATERRAIVQAVSEAYRTFDLHHRVEAVEVALWLAEDLGAAFWQPLSQPRCRVGIVLIEHLDEWNTPRIAPFLLQALRQRNWQRDVALRLACWSSPAEVTALLLRSDLLDDPQFRAALVRVKSPRWFSRLGPPFAEIPPELRRHIPRWVMNAGFTEDEKIAFFLRGAELADPELRFGMRWSLARFNRPQVVEFFRRISAGTSIEAAFARWYLSAIAAGLGAVLRCAFGDFVPEPGAPEVKRDFLPTGEFSRFWYACTSTPPAIRHDLIEVIRGRLHRWREEFTTRFRSEDARDRIIAIQVASRPDLAEQFAELLRALLLDPVEGIRQAATALARAAATRSRGPTRRAPADAARARGEARAGASGGGETPAAAGAAVPTDPIAALGLSDELAAARTTLDALFKGPGEHSAAGGGRSGGVEPGGEGRR